MPTAQCPHCGASYDVDGLATLCSTCLKPLPRREAGASTEDSADTGPSPIGPPLAPAPVAAPPTGPPAPAVAPSSPPPAAVTPAALRRPCTKCGEPLYATEVVCWKCGSHQTGAAVIPPGAVPVPGVPYAPPPPGYPPPPPSPYPDAGSTYPYGATPEAMNRANLSLILGIVGLALACCWGVPGVVLGPIAIWLGTSARREGAEGTATAGIVCGIIAIILGLIGIAIAIIMIAAGMFASGTSGSSPIP